MPAIPKSVISSLDLSWARPHTYSMFDFSTDMSSRNLQANSEEVSSSLTPHILLSPHLGAWSFRTQLPKSFHS